MIAGGKLTTYRVMANDAIDAAAHSLDDHRSTPPCATRSPTGCRWSGAAGFEARTNQRVMLSRRAGLHVARIDHLLGRYGGLVDEVLALSRQRPELAAAPGGRGRLPRRRRWCTPSPTRAPATSTTC